MKLWNQDSRLVVGLMSGTSADGVDAVLTRITGSGTDTKVEPLGFYFEPFDAAPRQAILDICTGEHGGTREVCLLGTHFVLLLVLRKPRSLRAVIALEAAHNEA